MDGGGRGEGRRMGGSGDGGRGGGGEGIEGREADGWSRRREMGGNSERMNSCCRLEESGQTALGPALLVSISLAARVPGSKVRWHMLLHMPPHASFPLLTTCFPLLTTCFPLLTTCFPLLTTDHHLHRWTGQQRCWELGW